MSKIKILVMDVDGTLTDGKIYMGQKGESVKAFDIKDGAGIDLLLPKHDIVPVIITARKSQILENRCKELKIDELHQNCFYKLEKLYEIVNRYGIGMDSVAYAGDDLPDIPCMEVVKNAGGVVLCPADAIPEIKEIANHVSVCKAGEGAIRDCINYLFQKIADESTVKGKVDRAISFILAGIFDEKINGNLPDGSPYSIQEYMTKDESDCRIETHRNHIDIQYMISGHERFKIYSTQCLTSTGIYNENNDAEYWKEGIEVSHSIMNPGSLIVVYNGQPHKGAVKIKTPESVKKLVCKIEV